MKLVEVSHGLSSKKTSQLIDLFTSISGLYETLEKQNKARRNIKKALKIAKKDLNKKDLLWAKIYMSAGQVEYGAQAYRSAEKYYKQAEKIYQTAYGARHLQTKAASLLIAKSYITRKKYKKGEKILVDIVDSLQGNVPVKSRVLILAHRFLVHLYEKRGQRDKATKHCLALAFANPQDRVDSHKPLVKVPPVWPIFSRRAGKTRATIYMEFSVTETGMVEDISVVKTVGRKIFEEIAVEALKKWRYIPAVRGGEPVKTTSLRQQFSYAVIE